MDAKAGVDADLIGVLTQQPCPDTGNVPAQVSASVITPALLPITWRAILSTRRVISAAARRENVISKMRRGSAPVTIKWATLCARVLVLPEPAPAITRSGLK
jgi:hypothetical protein